MPVASSKAFAQAWYAGSWSASHSQYSTALEVCDGAVVLEEHAASAAPAAPMPSAARAPRRLMGVCRRRCLFIIVSLT